MFITKEVMAIDFPEHRCGLYLTHNEHKDIYEPIVQWAADNIDDGQWVSKEEKTSALAADDVWVLQWYPTTPIGFYKLAGYNLGAVLSAARCVTPSVG